MATEPPQLRKKSGLMRPADPLQRTAEERRTLEASSQGSSQGDDESPDQVSPLNGRRPERSGQMATAYHIALVVVCAVILVLLILGANVLLSQARASEGAAAQARQALLQLPTARTVRAKTSDRGKGEASVEEPENEGHLESKLSKRQRKRLHLQSQLSAAAVQIEVESTKDQAVDDKPEESFHLGVDSTAQ